ncbi:DUF6760 family protein [Methylobacterium currus]|uniref:DUF6760 family protein n=1 Tax=Methylobacterium currus TaxID=2051553 RepID=UPI002F262AF6
MPELQPRLRGGIRRGGILGYPLDQLYEEVAFLAYHFHWPLDQLVALEHAERRKWVSEVSRMNERSIAEAKASLELT